MLGDQLERFIFSHPLKRIPASMMAALNPTSGLNNWFGVPEVAKGKLVKVRHWSSAIAKKL